MWTKEMIKSQEKVTQAYLKKEGLSEDLKRDLQEAAQREKRIRIIIAISLTIILGVLTWLIL
tara:strand:- start:775 stop:960 length:186 start_codon:yes stop_codon:yes gene_type:complete